MNYFVEVMPVYTECRA